MYPTEELGRYIRQLLGTLVGMTGGRDALGYRWVTRKLLKSGMKALLVGFGLRPKLTQLSPEVIGIDIRIVAFNLDGVHVRFHVDPKFFKFLDFGSSLLQTMLTATSAGALFV